MSRTRIIEAKDLMGQSVTLFGWVQARRDHGKIIFIDLRDASGLIQVVFTPGQVQMYETANRLRSEWVVRITGKVNARPEKMVNPDLPTGKVEIEPQELEVLNEALTPPFPLDTDGYEIGEESRLKYRYLDLRRPRLQDNLRLRHSVIKYIRAYLDAQGFVEIETPIISKSTPEGARDYVVPSRLYPGMFYALPQSPQQYKQLLMVGGVERYFQIARCFRDEDTRADRGFEHTQVDIEVSFMNQDEFMALDEEMMISVAESLGYKIKQKPFPVFSYQEAIQKFGT